jgi:hypothetical protein
MKVTSLLVEVRDKNLNRVGLIDPKYLVGFTIVSRFNAIGTWTLTLPATHPLASALQTTGSGIIVSLKGKTIISGYTTWMNQTQTVDDPDGVIQFTGLDDSVLLRDHLAYPTPTTADVTLQTSAYDVRNGKAETVMKSYVNANIGPSAPAARKITGLTVETDLARGNTVTGSARFDVLYELLQVLADTSALGFDIIQVGTAQAFQVYLPTDRSKTVRLDIVNNKLLETIYSLAQPKFTRTIVGGSGDGAARVFVERSSTVSLAAETAWGRRIEAFIDSRDTSDSVALATAGDSALATDGKSQITASIKPADDTTMLYGIDWFLGDTVTVVIGGYELSAIVTELGISVQEDGVRLYGTVGEPKLQSYESQILSRQADLASRLNNLEKYK